MLSDVETTLLLNRISVVRAAIEHGQPKTAVYALNLIELQITRIHEGIPVEWVLSPV